MTLLLRCKHCGNHMKFLARTARSLLSARKRCVYCGKSYAVKDAIIKHREKP